MSKKIVVEMSEDQLYYVTKILGELTEELSLGILRGVEEMDCSNEESEKIQELIKRHEQDEEYSQNVFNNLMDQLEEATGVCE